jgi:ribulose-phosphate 3-epimerase
MCFDWLEAGKHLRQCEQFGIDFLHFDVIDGKFASDFTMGSSIIDRFRENTSIPSDYHLMAEEPSRIFHSFRVSPNDYYTIHQECCRNLHRDLVSLRKMGVKVGVAVSPGTSLHALEYVLEDADMILLMMVDPGFKGQPIVAQTIRKIGMLRKMIDDAGLPIKISVDGNVNAVTVPAMVAQGADVLVLGSSGLFRKDISFEQSITLLHRAIDEGLKSRLQPPSMEVYASSIETLAESSKG